MGYANMTRFEWAYPSGAEDVRNQWISGSTMILATIIMNMVYLVSETRLRFGEKGINDPQTKLGITIFTFMVLTGLQQFGVIDPSKLEEKASWNSTSKYKMTADRLALGPLIDKQRLVDP